jgi:hypothetical protein
MSWGFMLVQNGRAPRPVTNVRDDKILTSRFWKRSFEGAELARSGYLFLRTERRCEASHVALVLAQRFRAAAALCSLRDLAAVQRAKTAPTSGSTRTPL